jgi:23S rRNA (adenine2503-C2)-methyltransferase
VREFCAELRKGGVNATVRRTRGTEIDAACGQLRADHAITEVTVSPNPRP